MNSKTSQISSALAIVIGTDLQEQIARKIIPAIRRIPGISRLAVISLDGYYRFGFRHEDCGEVISLRGVIDKPWYDLPRPFKLVSLLPFAFQFLRLSRKFNHFLFFVDTGILERTAISILNGFGRHTLVLQDAMKLHPKKDHPRSLRWFGRGGADLYLVMGERSGSMVRGKSRIVGSPIFSKSFNPIPPGRNILVINQCFSLYRDVSERVEFEFMEEVTKAASDFGPVELRLHPHNLPSRYLTLSSSRVAVTQNIPLSVSLENAGIVLLVNSTVVLQALASGRPLLSLDWHPSPYLLPLKEGVVACHTIDDMIKALASWKNGGQLNPCPPEANIKHELESFIACSGKDSVERIVRTLESYLTGSQLR